MIAKSQIFILYVLLFFSLRAGESELFLPKADKKNDFLELHGYKILDEYQWLQIKENPQVREYVDAENEYTNQMMKDTIELQKLLLDEMNSRKSIKKLDRYKTIGEYNYSQKNVDDKRGLFRRHQDSQEEEMILNLTELSENLAFFRMITYKVSPNNNFIAYIVDTTGDEIGTLFIKNIENNQILSVTNGISHMVEWLDDEYLFYVTKEFPFKEKNLYRHKLHSQPGDDVLVKQIEGEGGITLLKFSKDDVSLIIVDERGDSAETLSKENPLGKFQTIISPQPKAITFAKAEDKIIQMLPQDNGETKIVSYPLNQFSKREILRSYPPETAVLNYTIKKDYFIIWEQKDGSAYINCIDRKTNESRYIKFPEPSYNIWEGENPDYELNKYYFTYSSLNTPSRLYEYDIENDVLEIKEETVIDHFDQELYQVEKVFALSHDEKSIPISLVYRTDKFKKDGSNPLFLRAYGAYGYSQDPWFIPQIFSLLDRGFIYAIAHVRGGKEMGQIWHEQGKKLNKLNSFKDFISSAEFLIEEKYTNNDKIVAFGRSAGGMLVTGAINMRPDLFAVALPEVPACDVLNWLHLMNEDFFNRAEFGDPSNKEEFEYMLGWSPYEGIAKQNYPHLFISGGWNDPRVAYWQPLKYTARLRDRKTDDNLLLLEMDTEAGHAGRHGNRDNYESWAFKYAFILKSLNIID
jgi:oligopeptidase B